MIRIFFNLGYILEYNVNFKPITQHRSLIIISKNLYVHRMDYIKCYFQYTVYESSWFTSFAYKMCKICQNSKHTIKLILNKVIFYYDKICAKTVICYKNSLKFDFKGSTQIVLKNLIT